MECDKVTWTTWIYKLANMGQPVEYLTRSRRTSFNLLVDTVNSQIVGSLSTPTIPPDILTIHPSKRLLRGLDLPSSLSRTTPLLASMVAGLANQESMSRPANPTPERDW
jgi:hypothetical protein